VTEPAAKLASEKKRRDTKARPAKRRASIFALIIGGAVLGLAGIILAGIVLFWETPKGIVRVEITDPSIQAAIDKDDFTIKGAGEKDISLKPGDHGLRIKRGDFVFETDKFILKKNDTVTLKVELLPGKVQVSKDGKPFRDFELGPDGAANNALAVLPGWGTVFDPDGDCKVTNAGGLLTINVPGTLHDLRVQRANSPRVLQDVDGDFTATVKVASAIRTDIGMLIPGTELYSLRSGALLIWLDEKSFVRFDRASIEIDGKIASQCRLMAFRNGQPVFGEQNGWPTVWYEVVADEITHLKLERRQGKIDASYSQDGGKTWKQVHGPFPTDLPAKVKVGVSAVNKTVKPLTVEFADLQITNSSVVAPAGNVLRTSGSGDQIDTSSISLKSRNTWTVEA
jgi:regulation of enolase protein 1 (concanavalin A-like superfamily)